jgi:SnoaL-like domain
MLNGRMQQKFTAGQFRSAVMAALVGVVVAAGVLVIARSEQPAPKDRAYPTRVALQAERALAQSAVQNLIGRYSFYHLANMYDDQRYVALYANGDPGLKIQLSSRGIWEGPDAAQRMVRSYLEQSGGKYVGDMSFHPVASPVVEVAADAQTARGAWLSPGAEAHNGFAGWIFVKYCADFRKMNGEWKIWHMLAYGMLATTYDRSWAEKQPPMPPRPALTGPYAPNRPVDPPAELYSTTTTQHLVPEPPLPYETWNDSMSCVK